MPTTVTRRIAKLEAIPDIVPVPDRRQPYSMWAFARALAAAERQQAQRQIASLVWEWRGRPDMAAVTDTGDLDAMQAAFVTLTDHERIGMRAAADVLLKYLESHVVALGSLDLMPPSLSDP